MSVNSDKLNMLISTGVMCASIAEGIRKCFQFKKERKNVELEVLRMQQIIAQNRKSTDKLFEELFGKDFTTMRTEKEASNRRNDNSSKIIKISEQEKESIPIAEWPRALTVEKVREMMAQYGKTVDDFRKDFPDAIIIG